MTLFEEGSRIFVDETQRKPNKYATNVLAGIAGVVATVTAMNEFGVFTLDRSLVFICLAVSILEGVAARFILKNERLIEHRASKYVIMTMVLFLVLTLTVLLNVHAVLAFALPILLATRYRSQRISNLALIGSCVCCALAPVLSFLLDTWNLNFMIGYIQTFCRVTVDVTPGNALSVLESIIQITLYWSLPQMMTLGAFGIILYSATQSGIKSVTDQIQVADLGRDRDEKLASILKMQERVLFAMSDIIESRDVETGDHVRRTSEIVRLIANAMKNDPKSGVTDEFLSMVVKASPMHDIGKIAVPDMILKKPGRLTIEEYEKVKLHAIKSAEIIAKALTGLEDEELLTTAKNLAMYHHERYDGKGYPEGLSGKQIPLEARIMAIADVYDALVSERCYKAPMSLEDAFNTVQSCMGTQFDPDLNRYFIECRSDIEAFYRN